MKRYWRALILIPLIILTVISLFISINLDNPISFIIMIVLLAIFVVIAYPKVWEVSLELLDLLDLFKFFD